MSYCKPITVRPAECTCHAQEQMSRTRRSLSYGYAEIISLVDQSVCYYVCCLDEMNRRHRNSHGCRIKPPCDVPGYYTISKCVNPAKAPRRPNSTILELSAETDSMLRCRLKTKCTAEESDCESRSSLADSFHLGCQSCQT